MAASDEENQKIDQELRLAVSVPESERLDTPDLSVGYESERKVWEVIVRYWGSLDRIRSEVTNQINQLSNGYAIITLTEDQIPLLMKYPEIIYVEKPKRLYETLDVGVAASCVAVVQRPEIGLFGSGVLVGIIDSGEGVIILSSCQEPSKYRSFRRFPPTENGKSIVILT